MLKCQVYVYLGFWTDLANFKQVWIVNACHLVLQRNNTQKNRMNTLYQEEYLLSPLNV